VQAKFILSCLLGISFKHLVHQNLAKSFSDANQFLLL